jgi:hypothetical protein
MGHVSSPTNLAADRAITLPRSFFSVICRSPGLPVRVCRPAVGMLFFAFGESKGYSPRNVFRTPQNRAATVHPSPRKTATHPPCLATHAQRASAVWSFANPLTTGRHPDQPRPDAILPLERVQAGTSPPRRPGAVNRRDGVKLLPTATMDPNRAHCRLITDKLSGGRGGEV